MAFSDPQNFWTAPAKTDPKRNFRFRITLFGEQIWWAKDVDQPAATMSKTSHDFMMHKFHWPSKLTWNEVSMTLVDPVTPGTLDQLLLTLQDTGYIIPANPNDGAYSSISKAGATNATGTVLIEVLDAQGAPLHQWKLNNAFVLEVSPSKLSYTDEELMTVALKLSYDWATYTSFDPDVPDAALSNGLFQP